MRDYGLVSIITPSYNSEAFIERTIASVQKQTYTNWELLITDDCSKDNTVKLIKEIVLKDSRVKLFQLDINSGAGIARNNSIEHASGKYIAFLDSDDMWMPEKLEQQITFMENKGAALSYTSYMVVDEVDDVVGMVLAPHKYTHRMSLKDNKIGFSSCIYNKDICGKIFMPTIRKRQDWGLIMTILQKIKIAYGMKQPLVYYRKGQNSLSSNKFSLIKYNIQVYQVVLGWGYFRALLQMFFVFFPSYFYKNVINRIVNKY